MSARREKRACVLVTKLMKRIEPANGDIAEKGQTQREFQKRMTHQNGEPTDRKGSGKGNVR